MDRLTYIDVAASPPLQYGDNPLNENELLSVRALITYVAYTKNLHEDTVSEIVRTRFDVPEVTKLRQRNYDDAVRFLVDFTESIN